MDNVLIVSKNKQSIRVLSEMLEEIGCERITNAFNCYEARTILNNESFGLVIINAPLDDELGIDFAKQIASIDFCQVIIIVKNDYLDKITEATDEFGIITIPKPINSNVFKMALKMTNTIQKRLNSIRTENSKLTKKIEDIKIVDRAKCILISHIKMSEQESHKYIERQAMDMRVSKRIVAEGILKTYEN